MTGIGPQGVQVEGQVVELLERIANAVETIAHVLDHEHVNVREIGSR